MPWVESRSLAEAPRPSVASLAVSPLSPDRERALQPQDTFTECAKYPEMVVVPDGKFLMGSPEDQGRPAERPQHEATIAKPFAVSKFEVTFDDWDACVAHGDCPHASDVGWGRGRQPVIKVSRDDAKRYVAWLSTITGKAYRLLSETEWEYAARAGRRPPIPGAMRSARATPTVTAAAMNGWPGPSRSAHSHQCVCALRHAR